MFTLRLERFVPYNTSFPWDSGGSRSWLGFLEMSICVSLGSWMKLIRVFRMSAMSAPVKIAQRFRAWCRHAFHYLHHAILGCYMFSLRLESCVPYSISFPWDSGGSCSWLGFLEMSFCVSLGSWMKLIGVFGILVYACGGMSFLQIKVFV